MTLTFTLNITFARNTLPACRYSGVGPNNGPRKAFVNFANASAREWWVNDYVLGSVANQSLLDGVHWDCSCEVSPPV